MLLRGSREWPITVPHKSRKSVRISNQHIHILSACFLKRFDEKREKRRIQGCHSGAVLSQLTLWLIKVQHYTGESTRYFSKSLTKKITNLKEFLTTREISNKLKSIQNWTRNRQCFLLSQVSVPSHSPTSFSYHLKWAKKTGCCCSVGCLWQAAPSEKSQIQFPQQTHC